MKYSLNYTGLIDEHQICIKKLYEGAEKNKFRTRFTNFMESEKSNQQIINLQDNILSYYSESYIPVKANLNKKNLFLILGNPAPESIALKALFAYENAGKKYHRFWEVLHDTGILKFDQHPRFVPPATKMDILFKGNYSSPFNVYILPFYSFPTPPGGRWSGVAGIKKLFTDRFSIIESYEIQRIKLILEQCATNEDIILVFQKDAYLALISDHKLLEHPIYCYRNLLKQPLISTLQINENKLINLICMLPTRLLQSGLTKKILFYLAQNSKSPACQFIQSFPRELR